MIKRVLINFIPICAFATKSSGLKRRIKDKSDLADLHYEKGLWERSFVHVFGCDEVGRGPLAGPVAATAVYIPVDFVATDMHKLVADSKSISEKVRSKIYDETIKSITYSTVFLDNNVIDRDNILKSSLNAMLQAIENVINKVKATNSNDLNSAECIALIDGNKTPSKLSISSKPIVGGDAKVFSIALASIIAKVERDKLMVGLIFD